MFHPKDKVVLRDLKIQSGSQRPLDCEFGMLLTELHGRLKCVLPLFVLPVGFVIVILILINARLPLQLFILVMVMHSMFY